MKTIALSVDYGWIDKAETTLKSIYAHNQDVKTYADCKIKLNT